MFQQAPDPKPDPNPSPISSKLQSQKDEAIQKLPVAHREAPVDKESTESLETGLRRIQDWAFTQGFAVVTGSHTPERLRILSLLTTQNKRPTTML